jgi:hypothetical protein
MLDQYFEVAQDGSFLNSVFLNLSGATNPPLNFVVPAEPLSKTISYNFTKRKGITKMQNHKYYIKLGTRICAGTINSVRYKVLKHIHHVLK